MLSPCSSSYKSSEDGCVHPRLLFNNHSNIPHLVTPDSTDLGESDRESLYPSSTPSDTMDESYSNALHSWSSSSSDSEPWKDAYVPMRFNRRPHLSTPTFSRTGSFTKKCNYGGESYVGQQTLKIPSGRKYSTSQEYFKVEPSDDAFLDPSCGNISFTEGCPLISCAGADQSTSSGRGGLAARGLGSSRKTSLAPSASGSQRSRSHDLSEEDSEDDEDDDSRREKGKGKDSDADFSYACPYARGDRVTYERCVFRSFPTLRKLRIHLHNTHFKLFKSETCEHRAGTRAELARHLKTKGHMENPQRCPADNGLPSLKEAENLFEQVKMRSSSTQTWDDIFRLLHSAWNFPLPRERYIQYSAFVDCFPFTPGEGEANRPQEGDTPMTEAPISELSFGAATTPQAGLLLHENANLRGEIRRLTGEMQNMHQEIRSLTEQVAFLLKYYEFYGYVAEQDPERVQAFEQKRGLSAQGAFFD